MGVHARRVRTLDLADEGRRMMDEGRGIRKKITTKTARTPRRGLTKEALAKTPVCVRTRTGRPRTQREAKRLSAISFQRSAGQGME